MAKAKVPPHSEAAIIVAHQVVERITSDAARYAGRSERGGIFIGLRRGPHIEITEATLPMRWDMGSMFAFRRASRGHKEVAQKHWQASAHTMDWVGEWHSHPQDVPLPSTIDTSSWREITKRRAAPMAFLIVGYSELWVGLSRPNLHKPIKYVEVERSAAGIGYKPER